MNSIEQENAPSEKPFKTCGCGKSWPTKHNFLHDPELEIIGYQPNLEFLALGLFLFNHTCKTTLAIKAGELVDLHDGDVIEDTPPENERPSHLCIKKSAAPCPGRCTCRFVRNIVEIVKRYQGRD